MNETPTESVTHAQVSFEREYRALTEGAAWRVMEERMMVRVSGEDRVAFLHGMSSADIKALEPGGIAASLLLTEHAHVISEFFVWAAADALLIDIARAAWEPTRAALERFLVADDVEMEERAGIALFDLEGPRASMALRLLGGVDGSEPALGRWIDSDGIEVGALLRCGSPSFTVVVPARRAAEMAGKLAAGQPGVLGVGAQALDVLRVENGLARVGVDTGVKTLGVEAALERAISFSKGCYVGQETIERATARGNLKKRLTGLRFDSGRVPTIGSSVILDGTEVGRVTSAVWSPRQGAIGLAILHHSAWEIGTSVTIRDSAQTARAVVSELPFK